MRALVLLLALAFPLALAQGDGGSRLVERDGWTEFIPDWREGPADVTFQNRTVHVPNGTFYATDGATWFYGNNLSAPGDEGYAGCRGTMHRADNGTYVSIASDQCALHPSVACSGARACEAALGVPHRTAPPATSPSPPTQTPSGGAPAPDCSGIETFCTPAPPAAALLVALPLVALALRRNRAA